MHTVIALQLHSLPGTIMEFCGDWQAPGHYLCPAQVATAHQANISLGTTMENGDQYDWRAPGPWHAESSYNSSHPANELRSLRARSQVRTAHTTPEDSS